MKEAYVSARYGPTASPGVRSAETQKTRIRKKVRDDGKTRKRLTGGVDMGMLFLIFVFFVFCLFLDGLFGIFKSLFDIWNIFNDRQ